MKIKYPFPHHHRIEKAIVSSGIPCNFIRPSFFMQNLSTKHAKDIKERNNIFIPFGSGLSVKGISLKGFEICDGNKEFVPAKAETRDNTVVVYSD